MLHLPNKKDRDADRGPSAGRSLGSSTEWLATFGMAGVLLACFFAWRMEPRRDVAPAVNPRSIAELNQSIGRVARSSGADAVLEIVLDQNVPLYEASAVTDLAQTALLISKGLKEHFSAKVLEGWLHNKTPEFVRRVILEPNAFSVVASVDAETVGFGSALKTGEVTLCYVAPSVRFKGAGKALLAAIEDHAARDGVQALRLESTRTARAFYLRNGFEAEGPPVLAFGIEGQPMRKELRPGG